MAEEYEPFDLGKKSRIDDVLVPDLDDAVLRTARIRKNQVSKCKCAVRSIVANSVKYYSHVTVDSEPVGDKCSLENLSINKYGPTDFPSAQTMSHLTKEVTSCLNEMSDLKKSQQAKGHVDQVVIGKRQAGKFSRIKSNHLIPVFH